MGYGADVKVNEYVGGEVGMIDNCIIKDGAYQLSDDNTYAVITFIQPNGAEINRREYEGQTDEEMTKVSISIKHVCTKLMSEEEYIAAIGNNVTGFVDFINKVNASLIGKISPEKKFRMLFHYNNKNYTQVSNFPPYIESMDVEVAKSTLTSKLNSKYIKERLVRKDLPTPDAEQTVNVNKTEDEAFNDLMNV